MTKAELIAEITGFYVYVGIPFSHYSSDLHVSPDITNYSVIVYETGLSEISKKPVLKSKCVNFIVYNDGEVGEQAYYSDDELTNNVNTDVTSTGTLLDINRMFESTSLRGRVQAAIAKASQDVLNEAVPSTTLAFNASSAQKEVICATGTGTIFWPGKVVIIGDDNNYEENIVFAVNSDYVTLNNNLANSYTVADNAYIRFSDNVERQQWAVNSLINPAAFILSMTSLVSLNATIQAAGGLATDNDIQFVVNSYISKLAAASYL